MTPKREPAGSRSAGETAEPVIAVNKEGRVVHSFGRGLFKVPHSIRLVPNGNVWTVDAGNSRVIEFAPDGKELPHIDVGDQEQKQMAVSAEQLILRLRQEASKCQNTGLEVGFMRRINPLSCICVSFGSTMHRG